MKIKYTACLNFFSTCFTCYSHRCPPQVNKQECISDQMYADTDRQTYAHTCRPKNHTLTWDLILAVRYIETPDCVC